MLSIKFSQPRSTSRDAFPVSKITDIERMVMPSGLTVSKSLYIDILFCPDNLPKFPVLVKTAGYPSARRSQTISEAYWHYIRSRVSRQTRFGFPGQVL